MELQICVADAYAAKASRGEACWNLGSGFFSKPEEGSPSGSKDCGPAYPQTLAVSLCARAGWGDSLSKCCCCPIPWHPGELRQGQERSNTPPNSRSSLPQGSRKNPQTWLPVLFPSLTAVSLVIYEMQMMMAIMRIIIPALAASRLS